MSVARPIPETHFHRFGQSPCFELITRLSATHAATYAHSARNNFGITGRALGSPPHLGVRDTLARHRSHREGLRGFFSRRLLSRSRACGGAPAIRQSPAQCGHRPRYHWRCRGAVAPAMPVWHAAFDGYSFVLRALAKPIDEVLRHVPRVAKRRGATRARVRRPKPTSSAGSISVVRTRARAAVPRHAVVDQDVDNLFRPEIRARDLSPGHAVRSQKPRRHIPRHLQRGHIDMRPLRGDTLLHDALPARQRRVRRAVRALPRTQTHVRGRVSVVRPDLHARAGVRRPRRQCQQRHREQRA